MSAKVPIYHWAWLLLLFVAMACLTGLGGEYALNDDWIFASGVRSLLEQGELSYLSPSAPNLFLQVAWGWLCCKIGGGFSFVTLRLSVLIFAVLGLFAFYQWILAVSERAQTAFFAGLLLLCQPIYYNLSFSFMTDVPFTALALVSLWQYTLFFKTNKTAHRAMGILAAIAAFFIRQPGLMLWAVPEIIYFLQQPRAPRRWLIAFAHAVGAVGLYIGMEHGLKVYLTDDYFRPAESMLFTSPLLGVKHFAMRYVLTLFYLGLFLLPFLPHAVAHLRKTRSWQAPWFLALVALNIFFTLALWQQFGRVFPYHGYTIYNLGLGTPILADFHYERLRQFPQLPIWLMVALGMVVQVYSFLLLGGLLRGIRRWYARSAYNPMDLTVCVFAVLYTGIMYLWAFLDRYVLMLFALAIYGIARTRPTWMRPTWAGVLMILGLGWYVVAGTHDYLAWNQAVTDKKIELVQVRGIPRDDIAAGYPQDGWDKGGSYVREDATYYMTWGEMEGYTLVERFDYPRWLPGKGRIYLLTKN